MGAAPASSLEIASVSLPSKVDGAASEGKAAPMEVAEREKKAPELFYTVGSPALLEARKSMAAFSFQVCRGALGVDEMQ